MGTRKFQYRLTVAFLVVVAALWAWSYIKFVGNGTAVVHWLNRPSFSIGYAIAPGCILGMYRSRGQGYLSISIPFWPWACVGAILLFITRKRMRRFIPAFPISVEQGRNEQSTVAVRPAV